MTPRHDDAMGTMQNPGGQGPSSCGPKGPLECSCDPKLAPTPAQRAGNDHSCRLYINDPVTLMSMGIVRDAGGPVGIVEGSYEPEGSLEGGCDAAVPARPQPPLWLSSHHTRAAAVPSGNPPTPHPGRALRGPCDVPAPGRAVPATERPVGAGVQAGAHTALKVFLTNLSRRTEAKFANIIRDINEQDDINRQKNSKLRKGGGPRAPVGAARSGFSEGGWKVNKSPTPPRWVLGLPQQQHAKCPNLDPNPNPNPNHTPDPSPSQT